jgi:hypothetical protein
MKNQTGDPLTDRQRDVLLYVARKMAERGWPPTIREIMNVFGFGSTNAVVCHLRPLEAKGYLTRQSWTARGIAVTEMGRSHAAGFGVHLGASHVRGDWLPINTAPRDGTEVCVAGRDEKHGWRCWPDRWCEDAWTDAPGWLMAAEFGVDPTHWIPFPEVAPADPETRTPCPPAP